MIRFLLKGLLRDRSRSLFPVLTVAVGVMLIVFLDSWITGAVSSVTRLTAHFRTGHVCIMSRAYAARVDQSSNELALLGVDTLMTGLKAEFPEIDWTPRITFGGLLDVPDDNGETREQSPVSGLGLDMLSPESHDRGLLNIRRALVRGGFPKYPGEILIAEELAQNMHLVPGARATLVSSTMNGSMAFATATIAGTVRFGVEALDRTAIMMDLADVRSALDMADGASSILGFFHDDEYHAEQADAMASRFNARYAAVTDKFAPTMGTLPGVSGLTDYLDLVNSMSALIRLVFALAMSIVLWNAGLIGSLRRYGEIGLRLAVGEDKGHLYGAMLVESLAVGIVGSVIGTLVGLGIAWYLQVYGFDISFMMKNSSLLIPSVVHARISAGTYIVGLVPGILATFFGTAISGIGIYKRQTSQLFKELEA